MGHPPSTMPELVIFSTDAKLIQELRSECKGLPQVNFAEGNGPTVSKRERLDALKVSQMDAVERYGFNPPHPLFEARILKTPTTLIDQGLPRYAISGVSLPKDFRRDVRRELELTISAMLSAVKKFNSKGGDQIRRVGVIPESLSLDKLSATEVFRTLERIYGELDAI